jgi:hypothetical protein
MLNRVHRLPPVERHAAEALNPFCGQIGPARTGSALTIVNAGAIRFASMSCSFGALRRKPEGYVRPLACGRAPQSSPMCLNDLGRRNLGADIHARRCQRWTEITPTSFSMAIEVPKGLQRSWTSFRIRAAGSGEAARGCPFLETGRVPTHLDQLPPRTGSSSAGLPCCRADGSGRAAIVRAPPAETGLRPVPVPGRLRARRWK